MKRLSIALALAAVGVLAGYLWVGPLYTIYGGCACGSRREWKEFSDCAVLHGKLFGLRLTAEGDAGHKHEYEPMKYGQSGSWVGFVVCGLGLAAVVVELRRRGLAPSAPVAGALVVAHCLAATGANEPGQATAAAPSVSCARGDSQPSGFAGVQSPAAVPNLCRSTTRLL